MIACLAGAAGIALVIFVVIFIYLKSKNNFNYLKKTESQKKAPFNANRKLFNPQIYPQFTLENPWKS